MNVLDRVLVSAIVCLIVLIGAASAVAIITEAVQGNPWPLMVAAVLSVVFAVTFVSLGSRSPVEEKRSSHDESPTQRP